MERRTRLEEFMQRMGISPTRVVAEAKKISPHLGVPPFTRQLLRRVRQGRSASERVIALVVAVMRSITGMAVQASELFDLEPALPGLSRAALMGHSDPFRSGSRLLSVFSLPHAAYWWRHSVAEQEPLSATRIVELLYDRHAAFLRATAKFRYGLPPEDAEELVNDIFISFLRRQPRVDDERAYLLGALRNAVAYYRRKRRHETPLLPEHEDTEDPNSLAREEEWTLRISLGLTLAQMGERCRETLRRYYLLEQPTEQIAEELNTSSAYVFQLLHNCRKRARVIYEKLTSAPR
jgi:RNA polymerase sigma factor (sigma-70 family)